MRPARLRHVLLVAGLCLASACTTVGPDYETPQTLLDSAEAWSLPLGPEIETADVAVRWWEVFEDPLLAEFVEEARAQNLTLEIVALRVLEARARLGIAEGLRYPQAQLVAGEAAYVSPAESELLDLLGIGDFRNYGVGASVSWEADFWGRYRRSIEAADAGLAASVAAFDQATILLTAQVVDAYIALREAQEQLRISRQNLDIQRRSVEIAEVLFRNGEESELDVQQARSQLLGTESTIPAIEAAAQQVLNALSNLLGREPGYVDARLTEARGIPNSRENVAIGLPADLLRRRPDLREAEFLAMAQSAVVGVATADLYPSFQLSGTLGTSAGGPADTPFDELFSAGSFAGTIAGNFVWPFLNYGRIRNNIRVEDARLQQALLNYRNTALVAARETEDAITQLLGAREQATVLIAATQTSQRAYELSLLRYQEGFSDFERVLNSQERLFVQQQRQVTNQADTARSIVALYRALGAGWEERDGAPRISAQTVAEMRERTDWDDLLDAYAE